ncbi:MAG: UDP-N-acetylglucosamine 1-carboxyvinyltransferase [Deltaproteobacteria bacterium]|jgi:UDP-N-acetylglucosamine 1-carboxyvinyltransferase|nr:UDP-N-acetylglucosamine 1-carboxyvinyltransferase [Deltaproteobacteria bacterium]
MSHFKIKGGIPLKGEITPSGNKNEALPALAACVLTDDVVILKRVPRIVDVLIQCEVLTNLGAKLVWLDEETIQVDCSSLNSYIPDKSLCSKARGTILLLGSLLSRFSKVKLPLPGGDIIGARRLDTHFEGITLLGANLKFSTIIDGDITELIGTDIFLDEPSVTGTENLLLLSVKAKGKTVIYNAACEPHVVGLCKMLNSMGAKISGLGSNRLEIEGVNSLHGTTHTIGVDFMEVGSFICLGAIGSNNITIKNVNLDDFKFILKTFSKIGINVEYQNNSFIIDGSANPLKIKTDISGQVATIYSQPWPAFPSDLMSVAIVAATQAQGTLIFFEKMYESRMFFTDKLIAMGATIILCDPHRVVVNGPCKLKGGYISSPDIRAGMALLIAALVAKEETEIADIYQIERGYYQIDKKLRALGADITKI